MTFGHTIEMQRHQACEQLRSILEAAEKTSLDDEWERRLARIRLEDAIRRLAPPSSYYLKDLEKDLSFDKWQFQKAITIARALLEDLENGYLTSIVEIIHANQFSSYLDMAEYLIAEGYKDASAVIAGSSLEVHLKNLADKNHIDLLDSNRKAKKTSRLSEDLASANVYDKNVQKLIIGWLGVRNEAAHGQYEAVKAKDVELMIKWIRTFIAENPA